MQIVVVQAIYMTRACPICMGMILIITYIYVVD